MNFWKVMSALWLVAAVVIGVEYVQERELTKFFEFAFLLLQGLVAWAVSKRDQEKG